MTDVVDTKSVWPYTKQFHNHTKHFVSHTKGAKDHTMQFVKHTKQFAERTKRFVKKEMSNSAIKWRFVKDTIYIAIQGKRCYHNAGFASCTRWEFGIQLYLFSYYNKAQK